MKTSKYLLLMILGLQLTACIKKDFDPENENIEITEREIDTTVIPALVGMDVPDDFSFQTSKSLEVILDVPDFLKGAVFSLYSKIGDADSVSIGKGTFDSSAHFEKKYTVSSRVDSLLVFTEYIGLVDDIRLPVNNSLVEFNYRPLYQSSASSGKRYEKPKMISRPASNKSTFSYIDTFDSQGVPENLAFSDIIEQNLLDDINASLPESIPGGIPVSNPEFLAGKETSLIIIKEADIWVTFISEGAGYRNVLGYYSYPIGQEPQTVEDIGIHNVIFPNVSMKGSGGGLVTGDRVYLGRFPANTVVSWFLVGNGWYGSDVGNGNGVYYSNPDLNPESTEDKRNHMVLLYDEVRELTLLGFEDLNRDGNSDDDFNDAVFYAKSNPVDAIQVGNFAAIKTNNDSDGDGINDELDDFPFDVNKAFNNYSPSINSTGRLVYEDLWPSQGDYDFNDLVVDYSFNLIANAENKVTALNGAFTIAHIGASFKNGFAMTLPIDPSLISGVTGQVLNGDYETVAANGTEIGTEANESIIILAGNTLLMEGQNIDVAITFSEPIQVSDLGDVPFNAFLISNGIRSREVHLPDMAPTSKADGLGTKDDYSDILMSRYYKSNKNMPWALNVYEGFTAPPESVPITIQYPRFKYWANSGGTQEQNWFIE